jgi:endonuclease/exonuclease/phosphatase family metal-dependent hydrolase
MRIATWNLERPRDREPRRAVHLREVLSRIRADLWVLTETNEGIAPHPGYVNASTLVMAGGDPGERKATIWSRWPIRPIPVQHPDRAVCAEVMPDEGPPLLVVGIVLPYHLDRGPHGVARAWEEHYGSIPVHGAEWRALRAAYPRHRVVVAGDFNQSRDGRLWPWGRQWYGTRHGRDALSRELASTDLVCVTEEDLVQAGKLQTKSTIDHICLDASTATAVRHVGAWEPGSGAGGVRLSDHNGVWVDLEL